MGHSSGQCCVRMRSMTVHEFVHILGERERTVLYSRIERVVVVGIHSGVCQWRSKLCS